MKKMFSIVFIVDCDGNIETEERIMKRTVDFIRDSFNANITNRRIKDVFMR